MVSVTRETIEWWSLLTVETEGNVDSGSSYERGPSLTRETREGWPLLTVETEMNGDSGSTYLRGPSLVGLLGLSCQYKTFLSCLGCLSRPSSKYCFFPHRTLFQLICPRCPASWAGGHAGLPVVLVCVFVRKVQIIQRLLCIGLLIPWLNPNIFFIIYSSFGLLLVCAYCFIVSQDAGFKPKTLYNSH